VEGWGDVVRCSSISSRATSGNVWLECSTGHGFLKEAERPSSGEIFIKASWRVR